MERTNLQETIMEIVTAYQTSQTESIVVVIPKRVREKLKITKGKRFIVKIDERGRIIYEPVKKETNTHA